MFSNDSLELHHKAPNANKQTLQEEIVFILLVFLIGCFTMAVFLCISTDTHPPTAAITTLLIYLSFIMQLLLKYLTHGTVIPCIL